MLRFRLVAILAVFFTFTTCTEKAPQVISPLHADLLPANAQPINVEISQVNCWVELDQFFVTGICANKSTTWQKIWLEATPLDADGNALSIEKHPSVILPTFSDAVPPSGQSSFFNAWPLHAFSGTPHSFKLKIAGATTQNSGPILVASKINSMKMLASTAPDQPATEEIAWQVNGSILNPLPTIANHPRLEVLVFGTDNRLWLSTLLNPEDPASQANFQFERKGPLQAQEDRPFTLQVFYASLPKALKEQKIGRVEILPFEARN